MPVPDGPQTTRFSCWSIHSRVRSDRWVGGGIDETVSSQVSKVLPVGNPAALRRVPIEERLPAGEFLGEQRPDRLRRVPSVALSRWRARRGRGGACAAAAAGATGRRPRRSARRSRARSSSEAFPGAGAGLQRVVLIGLRRCSPAGARRGSRRGRRRRNGRRWRRDRAPSRPVSAPWSAASSTASAIFALTRAGAGSGGLDEPHPGPVTERQERGLGGVGGLRVPAERPGRAGRVVGVVDPRVARRRQRMAGDLDRARARPGGWRRARRRRHGPTPRRRPACAGPSR